MPDFELPEGYADKDEYLRFLTYLGAKERWGKLTDEQTERIEFELDTIAKMGFPGIFLLSRIFWRLQGKWGFSRTGKRFRCRSAVAYCLRITDIDPIKYGLLFERFLNLDRISMPDIDIDFDERRKRRCSEICVNKYGHDKVAHIITFGTMAARWRSGMFARVQKLPLAEADRLAKMVPDRPEWLYRLLMPRSPKLAKERNSSNKLIAQTLKFAEVLEGP